MKHVPLFVMVSKIITDFIDKMCLLGYPRLISRENFRSTNFGLVAEILNWFCHQLDANSGINFLIKTEQERVAFVTSVVKFLVKWFSF
jgi:clusterin-associated protein 1